jgi:hypothetical protein
MKIRSLRLNNVKKKLNVMPLCALCVCIIRIPFELALPLKKYFSLVSIKIKLIKLKLKRINAELERKKWGFIFN